MLLILHTNNASKGFNMPCLGCSTGEGSTLLVRGLFALQGVESSKNYASEEDRYFSGFNFSKGFAFLIFTCFFDNLEN